MKICPTVRGEGGRGEGGWRFSFLASASACYDVYNNHYDDAYNKHCKVYLLETLLVENTYLLLVMLSLKNILITTNYFKLHI